MSLLGDEGAPQERLLVMLFQLRGVREEDAEGGIICIPTGRKKEWPALASHLSWYRKEEVDCTQKTPG